MRHSIIAVVSNDPQGLLFFGQQLKACEDLGQIITIHSPLDQLPDWHIPPDVLIAVEEQGDRGRFDKLARISERFPQTAVILLASEWSSDLVLRALQSGIREIVLKEDRPDKIHSVVKKVRQLQQDSQRPLGRVIAFMGCKGGSGTTFIATNLGYALSTFPETRVLVIDLNTSFGDAALFVTDRIPTAHLGSLLKPEKPVTLTDFEAALLGVSKTFHVLAAPEYPGDLPPIEPQVLSHLIRLARLRFDFVVLDLGRGLNRCALMALDLADQIIPVFQSTVPHLRDGRRLIEYFYSVGYGDHKISPVVNRHQRYGEITLKHLETVIQRKVERIIPNHHASVTASVNQGVPIVKLAFKSPVAKSLRDWAEDLVGAQQGNPRDWIQRVLH